MYRFSLTVLRLLISTCVEDSANAAIQEFRSVVVKLRTELNDAFKNAENLLENVVKPKVRGKGTLNNYLLSIYSPFHHPIEIERADTVEGVDTAGDNLDEKGLDLKEKDDCKAEAKSSSSEAEFKPTESTLPAAGTPELEAMPVVHTGKDCKECKVRTYLITDYFRRYL